MQSYGRLVYLHDSSRAYVGFELDGTVVVRSGVQDLGGGQASSIAQISAEILGVPMEDVTVYFGDTALTPLAGTTTATRMLYMSGNATLKAARTVREAIVAKASEMLEVDAERIDLADRMVRVEGDDIEIEGGHRLRGAVTKTLDDHRLAMTFAVAGLIATGATTVSDPACASISYPGFFAVLEGVRA